MLYIKSWVWLIVSHFRKIENSGINDKTEFIGERQ